LIRLEAAVRQANPVPELGDLSGSAESAAVALLIREKRDAMTTTRTPQLPTSESPPSRPASIRRRIPAFVLGLAMTLLVIGGAVVLRPGGGAGPVDQPSTTATSPPTTQPAPLDLATLVFPAEDVPPFAARIVYEMNPLGTEEWIPVGARMSVRVLFESPQRYLYEVLSVESAAGGTEAFGAAGLSILGDGEQAWIMEPGAAAAAWAENFAPVADLLWNSGFPAWDEICTDGQFTALGVEEVAGRMTSHGRCSTLTDDYELWVDTSTGIVMKLRGVLGPRDLIPSTAREGGFEITAFELGEVVLPPVSGPAPPPPDPPVDPPSDFIEGTALVKGEPAPTISGQLLDGSAFSIEDLRGRPVVVLHWGRGVATLEQGLDVFQALSEKWAGQVSFLGAPLEVLDEAQRLVERGGYTFDNMVCYRAEGNDHIELCKPGSVMDVWMLGWPTWVILDEDGNVVDAFGGGTGTFEHIDAVIDTVVNP
jgi:peroxiredoxin